MHNDAHLKSLNFVPRVPAARPATRPQRPPARPHHNAGTSADDINVDPSSNADGLPSLHLARRLFNY